MSSEHESKGLERKMSKFSHIRGTVKRVMDKETMKETQVR
jgi:hypothetical protein